MSLVLVTALLLGLVLLGAQALRWLLDRLAPVFVRRPVLGLATWTGAAVGWVLVLLAVGPVLAWSFTGSLLPGQAGLVCRRCLAAANPFGAAGPVTALPPGPALAVPAALLGGLLAVLTWQVVASRRRARCHLRALAVVGRQDTAREWTLPSAGAAAYSLPGGHVVLSTGARRLLEPPELAAVRAHEHAHVRQRHHLVLLVVGTLGRVFGWVPLLARAPLTAAALAEMAADDAAIAATDRITVARALAKMHSAPDSAPAGAPAGALHAAADLSRVQRLLGEQRPGTRLPALTALAVGYVLLTLAVPLMVATPYAHAVLTGAC